MVDSVMPEVIAVSIALVAVVAELLHLRRIKQVKFLAFGPGGRPALWTWAAPVLRVLGLAISAWGFASLWFCLLYTSPSPRDATLSRMPSSA